MFDFYHRQKPKKVAINRRQSGDKKTNPRISSRFFEKSRDCHLLTPAECIFMAENYFPEVAPCGT